MRLLLFPLEHGLYLAIIRNTVSSSDKLAVHQAADKLLMLAGVMPQTARYESTRQLVELELRREPRLLYCQLVVGGSPRLPQKLVTDEKQHLYVVGPSGQAESKEQPKHEEHLNKR